MVTCGYTTQAAFTRGQLLDGLSAGISTWSGAVLSLRDRGRVFAVGGVVGGVG
jgi:hypothetical protein